MEAATKFNIEDSIYFMHGEIPVKGTIKGISLFTGERKETTGSTWTSNKNEWNIEYHVEETPKPVNEKLAFGTKDELIKSLFDKLP